MSRLQQAPVFVCFCIGLLLVLTGRASGFNPQPEPPGKWYVEGFIDLWATSIDLSDTQPPFGIDTTIVDDGVLDFSAGVIARFSATATADNKPVDGRYDAEFEYFRLRIGDTTWDETMPSAIQFQVVGGVVNGCAGPFTVTIPEHPDLSFALRPLPGPGRPTMSGRIASRRTGVMLRAPTPCATARSPSRRRWGFSPWAASPC